MKYIYRYRSYNNAAMMLSDYAKMPSTVIDQMAAMMKRYYLIKRTQYKGKMY